MNPTKVQLKRMVCIARRELASGVGCPYEQGDAMGGCDGCEGYSAAERQQIKSHCWQERLRTEAENAQTSKRQIANHRKAAIARLMESARRPVPIGDAYYLEGYERGCRTGYDAGHSAAKEEAEETSPPPPLMPLGSDKEVWPLCPDCHVFHASNFLCPHRAFGRTASSRGWNCENH